MKKTLVVSLALGLTLAAGSAFAGTIVGSAHDLSGTAFNADGKICAFCHTPHHGVKPGTGASDLTYSPLWNKDLSTYSTVTGGAGFTLYDNGSDPTSGRHALNATLVQPTKTSLLCLSCHDGSIALNAYGSTARAMPNYSENPATINEVYIGDIDASGAATIGQGADLSNHHPIAFDYVAAQADDPEIAPATNDMIAGVTIESLLAGGTIMTCATCHDVHNTQALGDGFTWADNAASAFCIKCHDK